MKDLDDREDLLQFVSEMDQIYLIDAYKKRAAQQKAQAKKAKRGAKRSRISA